MSGSPTRAVLFDMDGTLLDSQSAIIAAWTATSAELLDSTLDALPISRAMLLTRSVDQSAASLAMETALDPSEISRVFHEHYSTSSGSIDWFPGAREVVGRVHELGAATGLVTTKVRERVDVHLRNVTWADAFDVVVGGDEVEQPKPEPEQLLAAAARLGIDPDFCVMVGDGPADIHAARAAGMMAVGVGYGFHPQDCLAASPELWAQTPADIFAAVQRALTTLEDSHG